MTRVVIHATTSLDGFIAGHHDEVGWSFRFGSDEMAEESIRGIGSVILGNRGFKEGFMNEDSIPYGGMVKVPQFVVTHEPRKPITLGGLTFTFVDGIEPAVEQARAAAGDKNVILLGASIDQQCLRAGLVDEIMIHVVPVLLGEGIRLFDHLGGRSIELKRTAIVSTGEVTSLRFRVLK